MTAGDSCNITTQIPIADSSAATPIALKVPVRKAYARCRFGQLHFRASMPTVFEGKAPLVCLHPTPYSGRFFTSMLEHVGGDRLVFAPDLPGCGDSDPPPHQIGIPEYAAAIGDFIDCVFPGPVDVFGYHAGSAIAIELALQYGLRIRRVILVSAPAFEKDERNNFLHHAEALMHLQSGTDAATFWREHASHAMPGWRLVDHFADTLCRPAASGACTREFLNYPFADKLSQVLQATTIFNPNDEFRVHTQRTASMSSKLRVLELPDWGFGFPDVQPDQVAALLRSQLDEGFS